MWNQAEVVLIAGCIASFACGPDRSESDQAQSSEQQHSSDSGTAVTRLAATMRNAQGKDLGRLTLTQAGEGIQVSGRLTNLPAGEHAIHLHAVGRCDMPSFESAGGHWNPTDKQHGTRSPGGPHLGDMPNIRVGQDGSAMVEVTTSGGSIRDQNALLDADGAAVVVHAKPDDTRAQPSGNAGDRIACGVVGT